MDVHRRREKSREDWDRKIRDVERVRAMFAKVKKPFVAPAKYGARAYTCTNTAPSH